MSPGHGVFGDYEAINEEGKVILKQIWYLKESRGIQVHSNASASNFCRKIDIPAPS